MQLIVKICSMKVRSIFCITCLCLFNCCAFFVGVDEEINIEHSSESKEDSAFEDIVGALENIILAEDFQELQNSFCDRNCSMSLHFIYSFGSSIFSTFEPLGIFEDNAENKLEYTTIFHEYTRCMEDHIQLKLRDVMPV